MKKIILILTCICLLSSCMTRINIDTNVDGATVFFDGEVKGETPLSIRVRSVAWYDPLVTISKDGYETQKTHFEIGPRVGNIVAGAVFLWAPVIGWPCLFTCAGPIKNQYFELEEATE